MSKMYSEKFLKKRNRVELYKLFTIAFCFIFTTGSFAQNTYWTQTGLGGGNDEGLSISIDDSNNTYTTGYFSGSITFGNTTLSTIGISDVFVVKTNSLGVYQWAEKGGDQGEDRGLAIKTDANGNSYVTGYYFGKATFGSKILNSAGIQDVFVVKYDRHGNVKWAVSGGGSGADIGNAITLDNKGNVLITGQFMDTAKFGTYTLTAVRNNINVFTAKLDSSNGNFLWAKSGTGPHTDRGIGVACDPAGNVYVTGQFTDTVTFDNIHNAAFYNAIFIVKYNSAGNEQWFTKAGGGIYDMVSGIVADNNYNVYITGTFRGTLYFFAQHLVSLTNKYANRVLVAKYDQNGNLVWDIAEGSSGNVNSNTIALDGSGNPYIMGNFECRMSGYADKYGQGTFNSVGYWDIYTTEYSASNGSWQWSRQLGGHGNNYGNSIAVSSTGDVFTACSFDTDMIVPWDSNYTGYNLSYDWGCPICDQNTFDCSNSYYGQFEHYTSDGKLSIFIAKPFSPTRPTYDYYYRADSTCNRPYIGVCISDGGCPGLCMDTIHGCVYAGLVASSNTEWNNCGEQFPGPYFNWVWSNKQTGPYISVNTNGWYYVTQTSMDGCFISRDSVYVIISPLPAQPTISDNVVINKNSTNPTPIHLCRDSVVLTGGNYGKNMYYWAWNYGYERAKTLKLFAPDSNEYSFVVFDSNGCINVTSIKVILDSILPPIVPALFCSYCSHDSLRLCPSEKEFVIFPYDTISNPQRNDEGIPIPYDVTCHWSVTPNSMIYQPVTDCNVFDGINQFIPQDSGWYHITDSVIRINTCGKDVHVVKDSIHIGFNPPLKISLSYQSSYLCPGDDEWLILSGKPTQFYWLTDYNNTSDSELVTGPGVYGVHADNQYGCDTEIYITVTSTPLPVITMNPPSGVVCPGDSVELTATNEDGTLSWEGPLGPAGGNVTSIYVKTPGGYNVVEKDTSGCIVVSNTAQVSQYSTPFLFATPNAVICAGDSVAILVIASPGSTIQWLSPLNGSDSIQYVKSSGTYTCKVTSCGIITVASVTVTVSTPVATITAVPPYICHNGDSVLLTPNKGMAVYVWEPGSMATQTFTVYQAGTYSLITYDEYGCSASTDITISQPVHLSDSIVAAVNPPCGGVNNGTIKLGVNGGVVAYKYSWSNGDTTANLSGLSGGTYSVMVSDQCGSTVTASVVLTQPPPMLDSITSVSNVICYGKSTGSATVVVIGGQNPFTYTWSGGGGSNATGTGLSAGTCTVTLTDAHGCSRKDSALITQSPIITPHVDSIGYVSCYGLSNGNIAVAASGGIPGYSYSWNPGGQKTPEITGLSAGIYTLTVTDSAGCTLTTGISLSQPNAISPSITTTPASCANNDGIISVSVTGGTNPYTYSWAPGGNTSSSYSGLSNGAYKVTITDSHGCVDTITGDIIINNTLTVTISGPDSACKGQLITLTASGASSYVWSNNSSSTGITVSSSSTTSYWVVGTEEYCTDSAKHTVGIYPPLVAVIPHIDSICSGKPVLIKVIVSGGDIPYTYSWNNGITTDSLMVNVQNTTSYTVRISDVCKYTTKDSVTIMIARPGIAAFTVVPDTIAPGQVVSLDNISAGTVSYSWIFGDGNTLAGFEPEHAYYANGVYQIILIGYTALGCPDTAYRDVYVNSEIIIPNIFTPNGDGINDVLYFTITGTICFHCEIYNRWGKLIYESNDINQGWNGNIDQSGAHASDGVYYYLLNYCDLNNVTHKLDGFVQLLRN